MRYDGDKVRENVRSAATEDLLDRVTAWRDGMEADALHEIEAELRSRGVRPSDVEAHAAKRAAETLRGADGSPLVCYRCANPAVAREWVWGRLWRLLPLFPRRVTVCAVHRSRAPVSPR